MVMLLLVVTVVIACMYKVQNGRYGTPMCCCSPVLLLVVIVVRSCKHKAWNDSCCKPVSCLLLHCFWLRRRRELVCERFSVVS